MKELEKKVTEVPVVQMILLDTGHRGYSSCLFEMALQWLPMQSRK